MQLADLVTQEAHLLDDEGQRLDWYDHTGPLPPLFDLSRCPAWADAAPGELYARHHFTTAPFDARLPDDGAPNSAVRRVCALLEEGFPVNSDSILVWYQAALGWGCTESGARWSDEPADRRALSTLLDAVRATIEAVVVTAAATPGSPYAGARISRIVPYNIQRRRRASSQYKPHFDYESRDPMIDHLVRCDPSLLGRPLTVMTIWTATEGLTSSPLCFYPRGALGTSLQLPSGNLSVIDVGDIAVTDSRATAAEGHAFVFNPNLCMHGAAGAPDADGQIHSLRKSLEIRSYVVWEDGLSPSTRDCRS